MWSAVDEQTPRERNIIGSTTWANHQIPLNNNDCNQSEIISARWLLAPDRHDSRLAARLARLPHAALVETCAKVCHMSEVDAVRYTDAVIA
jgi:hypothetical protein